MAMDVDVRFARDAWKSGTWTCFDVCESIERQWADRHVNDADGDKSNYNAHSPEDVAVFCEAAAACAVEVAKWIGKGAALLAVVK